MVEDSDSSENNIHVLQEVNIIVLIRFYTSAVLRFDIRHSAVQNIFHKVENLL